MRAATLLLLFTCLLAFTPPSATRAAAYDCEGDACPVVTLTWEEDGQRFRVENGSDSRVKVKVASYAGDSSVQVEPHKSDYLQVKYFNGPYRADFE